MSPRESSAVTPKQTQPMICMRCWNVRDPAIGTPFALALAGSAGHVEFPEWVRMPVGMLGRLGEFCAKKFLRDVYCLLSG